MKMQRVTTAILTAIIICALLTACAAQQGQTPDPASTVTPIEVAAETEPTTAPTEEPPTLAPTLTNTPAPTETPAPTDTPTATPTSAAPKPLIALDPGHGGVDLGARHFDAAGKFTMHESKAALEICLRLSEILQERGYRVLLTRDDNYSLMDAKTEEEYDTIKELQMRLDKVNEAQADLFLSIHMNGYDGGSHAATQEVWGTMTLYCDQRPFSDSNRRFAELAHAAVLDALTNLGHDAKDRGIQLDNSMPDPGQPPRHLIVLGPQSDRIVRPSQMPGILSEPVFISSDAEEAILADPEGIDALAHAYADAIDAYFAEQADTSAE
ncbi:MAG: N-acetylmuramoyl-L-alanine amidase [Chloroflexi bacterium]|nr:N-acetylmuramoyl-L-alanine amidase [Chloroflexota bacterium]